MAMVIVKEMIVMLMFMAMRIMMMITLARTITIIITTINLKMTPIKFPTPNRYLEKEHYMHCPDETYANGLGSLPLGFVFFDHTQRDGSQPATQKLPTGEVVSGAKTYETLMRFFTTLNISATELRQKAINRLNELYPQVRGLLPTYM